MKVRHFILSIITMTVLALTTTASAHDITIQGYGHAVHESSIQCFDVIDVDTKISIETIKLDLDDERIMTSLSSKVMHTRNGVAMVRFYVKSQHTAKYVNPYTSRNYQ